MSGLLHGVTVGISSDYAPARCWKGGGRGELPAMPRQDWTAPCSMVRGTGDTRFAVPWYTVLYLDMPYSVP